MKKFKIFLLLSILLCLGFTLSYEAHAQGDGPKKFEVGDVLPAGKIKISWDFTYKPFAGDHEFWIYGTNDFYITMWEFGNIHMTISELPDVDIYIHRYENLIGNVIISLDNDVTITELDGMKNYYEYIDGAIFWEVVPDTNDPKKFEVGDILPAGNIKISWDFTGKGVIDGGVFEISSDGDLFIEIREFVELSRYVEIIINDDNIYAATEPGGTVITITSPVTITSLDGNKDYYEYIDGALFWEVVSSDYADGYEDGYTDAYVHTREIYGYFDPITDQWLSVNEYLDLYGTVKLGQSDFYNNFDKYFIPAMIIVFGGAIVLTILKVFKGRE